MEHVDVVIIGAGVIGLAVAAELSNHFESIVLLERHESFGKETSSRNSEVIHAGIYYPTDSLKARLCVGGAPLLYDFCGAHSIAHRRVGKLIVAASESEVPELVALHRKGLQNGASGLRLLDQGDIKRLEPNVKAVASLLSENTGILDTHSLMKHLLYLAEQKGALVAFNSEVLGIEQSGGGYVVDVRQEEMRIFSRILINSAGLSSDRVAALAGIDVDAAGYRLHYCKGSYFQYDKKSPVSRLVYPIPHADLKGLGVHATLDLTGRLRFGPDTENIDEIDYRVDPAKKEAFYEGAAAIIEGLDPDHFSPDMAGVRPKIKGEGIKDFVIAEESARGLPGFVNLIGIESPGLTSCLSIARLVAGMLKDRA